MRATLRALPIVAVAALLSAGAVLAAPTALTPSPLFVRAGDVVTIMVRGGTGIETDPGDFGAIPVVITG